MLFGMTVFFLSLLAPFNEFKFFLFCAAVCRTVSCSHLERLSSLTVAAYSKTDRHIAGVYCKRREWKK